MIEQLSNLLGVPYSALVPLKGSPDPSTFSKAWTIAKELHQVHWGTAIFGLSGMIFLQSISFLKKRFRKTYIWSTQVPEILILLVSSSVLAYLLDFKGNGIEVLGEFNNTLPTPGLPRMSWDQFSRLFPDALVITIIGFIDSQSVTRHYGMKKGYFPSGDRELFALGASNVIGSMCGSYVAFGSMIRSRVQARSAANTNLVGALAAVIVFIMFTTLGFWLKFLPRAALAAIGMNAAISVIDYDTISFLFRMRDSLEIIQFLLIWALTFFIGIRTGILISFCFSALFILRRTTHVHLGLLGELHRVPNENDHDPFVRSKSVFVDLQDNPEAELVDGILPICIKGGLEFYNAGRLRRRLELLLDAGSLALEQSQLNGSPFHVNIRRRATLFVEATHHPQDLHIAVILDFSKCDSMVSLVNNSRILQRR